MKMFIIRNKKTGKYAEYLQKYRWDDIARVTWTGDASDAKLYKTREAAEKKGLPQAAEVLPIEAKEVFWFLDEICSKLVPAAYNSPYYADSPAEAIADAVNEKLAKIAEAQAEIDEIMAFAQKEGICGKS